MGYTEQMKEVEAALAESLRVLRMNREKVPEELLRTKYKKSYEKLKRRVRSLAEDYAKLYVLGGIRARKEDMPQIAEDINRTVAESGILPQAGRAVYEHQDLTELKKLLERLKCLVENAAAPYLRAQAEEGRKKEGKVTGKNAA